MGVSWERREKREEGHLGVGVPLCRNVGRVLGCASDLAVLRPHAPQPASEVKQAHGRVGLGQFRDTPWAYVNPIP
jgi:hypothetical protein